jgi:hypothetical protein
VAPTRRAAPAALVAIAIAAAALSTVTATPTAADSVSSLTARAHALTQQLVQAQLASGADQQQYSVASAEVAADARAITASRAQVVQDRALIATRLRQVRKLAVADYVLNGAVTPSSGAALFGEDVRTAETANEYATITIGDLNGALNQLHSAQRAETAQVRILTRQQTDDRAAQSAEAADLTAANASVDHLQSLQAQVVGQLATAVAAQQAVQSRTAAGAVTAAERGGHPSGGGGFATVGAGGKAPPADNTTDPALPPFLQCVVQAESGGNYQAVSPNGLYRGAFQFSQPTWNYAAQEAGRPDLVGVPPNQASKADQDTLAVALYALDGEQPWLGDRCSQ